MSLYQYSVLNKYLKELNQDKVKDAYQLFVEYFHNPVIQQNIRESKEEQFQEGFLRELFVNVLGYTNNPNPDFNLTTEFKNERGAKKADGAILKDRDAIAVIELKSTKTKDLESIRLQAFDYKANQQKCVYVITSNFEKVRFYINNAVDFEEFDLFKLKYEDFQLFWLCLAKDNILNGVPLAIKEFSILKEENVTKQIYVDYSLFKRELYADLIQSNLELDIFNGKEEKEIKLLLFKKSQKLLDRFLFIFFGEDRGLLPPNSISKIIEKWNHDKDWGENKPLYNIYKQYFNFLNIGRPARGERSEIFAYNGGLFSPDKVLDSIKISDEVLQRHTKVLTAYDFETDVDVNILGHIFENSLNEIEEVAAQIEGAEIDLKKSKRKKDGVFYTPKYITKYIVENTVGKLCKEKKTELGIDESEYLKSRKGRTTKKLKELDEKLGDYRNWLLTLTICDPACGSGAFLNQALDFLIREHHYIDELKAKLLDVPMIFTEVENSILENNIFGVDINEESVEIAKLSLWLRTAQKGRKLTSLSNNIKCGNSLIDDPEVAGEKAFNWHTEFPEIFRKKKKQAWHITTATHNSRYSQRMFDNYVQTGEAVWLSEKEEQLVIEAIAGIVKSDNLNVLACNICGDHLHLLLVCTEDEMPAIVQKMKSMSARACNIAMGRTIPATTKVHAPLPLQETTEQPGEHAPTTMEQAPLTRGKTQAHLWTQKFGCKKITSDEQFENTIAYIQNNRTKHELPENNELQAIVQKITSTREQAFRTGYTGGFDVVIGNPPYLRIQGLQDAYPELVKYYGSKYMSSTGNYDVYALFIEKSFELINNVGNVSLILPHKFLIADFGIGIRKYLLQNKAINELVNFGSELVFQDATTYTCIISLSKRKKLSINFKHISPAELFNEITFSQILYDKLDEGQWILTENKIGNVLDKIFKQPLQLKDIFDRFVQGIITGKDAVFCISGNVRGNYLELEGETGNKFMIEKNILKPHLRGEDVNKFKNLINNEWLIFPYKLDSGKAELYSPDEMQEKFPNAYEYLKLYEQVLRDRENGKFNNDYWYQYSRNQAISVLEQPKVITPEVCFGGSMTLDLNNFYHNSKCHTLLLNPKCGYELKSILPFINSRLFWFYLSNTGNVLRGGYIGVKRRVLELFPIPSAKLVNHEIFAHLSEDFLTKTAKIQSVQSNFIDLLQSKFEIVKISKKLQNWYELEFKDFLKELTKAKVKLTLSEEAEWMQYFNGQKQKAQTLKSEIDKTDREIDQMVYELYGLTEEEIGIVENY